MFIVVGDEDLTILELEPHQETLFQPCERMEPVWSGPGFFSGQDQWYNRKYSTGNGKLVSIKRRQTRIAKGLLASSKILKAAKKVEEI